MYSINFVKTDGRRFDGMITGSEPRLN